MGNQAQGPRVFAADDVLDQAAGTFGESGDIPVVPPKNSKEELLKRVDFTSIDEAAIKAPPELLLENFWDISDHLVVSKSFKVIDDLYRIRAIFRWLTSFDEESITSQILPPENSPLEYLIKIGSDFGDHANLLYVLCVSANIPCVVINGVSKHGFYEVGDEIRKEVLASKWNAVFVNGEWRLIDPFWAHTSIPYDQYRDQIAVDDEGQITLSTELGDTEGEPRPVNEFFFLCDPEKLICTHFPDEEQWQLLDDPITEERFQEQPYFREHYHEMGLGVSKGFPDTDNCILRPDGRPCKISFDLPKDRGATQDFKFSVTELDVDENTDTTDLEKYVMMSKSKSTLQFGVCFPFIGRFRLDVYGTDDTINNQFNLVFSYLIHCGVPIKNFSGFPEVPEHGWGPHPIAEELGIVPISPKSSVIKTETGIVEIRFPASKAREISHCLGSTNFDAATLSRHALGRLDSVRQEYFVYVRLPEQGDYTLKIFADVDELRGKIPDSTIMTYLIEFSGEAKNDPYPFVLGSQIGPKLGAFQLGVEAIDESNGVLMAWDGKLDLTFTADEDSALFSELSTSNPTARKVMNIKDKREDGKWLFSLNLPVAGLYSLNLFGWNEKEKHKKVEEVFSFLIQSTGSLSKEELEKLEKKTKGRRKVNSGITNMERSNTVLDSESQIAKSRVDTENNSSTKVSSDTGDIMKDGKGVDIISNLASPRDPISTGSFNSMNKPPTSTGYGRQQSRGSTKTTGTLDKESTTKGSTHSKEKPASDGSLKHSSSQKNRDTKSSDKATPRKGVLKKGDDNNASRDGVRTKRKAVSIVEATGKNDARHKKKKDELDVRTFQTTKNIVKIDIEHPIKTVFTSLRKTDAIDKPGDRAAVIKTKEGIEVRIQGYGRYQVDVMTKESGPHVKIVGRYTVIRVPSSNPSKDESMSNSKLFGGNEFDGNVFLDSDDEIPVREDVTVSKPKKVTPKTSDKVDYGTVVPDLRSIKSADLLDEFLQGRFTDATNRDMKAKLRKVLKVRDLSLILKYLELYQSTSKSTRNAIFPKAVQDIMKKIKQQQRLVEECKMETPVLMDEEIRVSKTPDVVRVVVTHKIMDKNTRKEKVSKVTLEINQIALTEIKQYANPPEGVHECIMATLVLLGDQPEDCKDFSACQGLLFRTGRQYIMRRITQFNTRCVPQDRVDFVSKIVKEFSMWQILDVSKGAAAFYMWVKAMLHDIKQRARSAAPSTTAKSTTSAKRVPPRPTILPEYISRRDGTIILRL
ncbi:uncharacterized protein LOC133175027 [Saccostrea echinata]|uniref:uncharacterized protein LOC133175027 n=1 Tax=Saccostrea echinata TaxID=191078 RepID=UPI002A8008AC|nr:uncharacterized protein LOC133175027 [Saccostrea echinata]